MSLQATDPSSVENILDEQVAVSDGLVFLSGLTAADPGTGIPAEATMSTEFPYYGSEIQKQTTHLLEKAARLLGTRGIGLQDVVKTQVFIADCRLFDAFDQVWKRFFPVPPPRSTVGVGADRLPVPGALVSVDIIAALPDVVEVRPLDSPRLPKPLANYTACVGAGDWLFLAGQLPTDFGATGLAPNAQVSSHFPHHVSPIIAQANYTIGICNTLLEDAGGDWDHVVRVQVFLKDLDDAPVFERLWQERFDGTPPPCTIIGVDELLTGGALIEIDVIAVRSGTPQYRRTIGNGSAPVVGERLSLSGAAKTTFVLADLDIDVVEHPGDRRHAVETAVREALAHAAAQAGPSARAIKVHAFLPNNEDVFPFGRALLDSQTQPVAVTTSPNIGASAHLALEIVLQTDS
ncbi:RidA family protein [[Mycobacterium] burgundiense]|uniref:RidA family protein n=1 Tax=[Mycobacterium] burgundiense TaxID=3064286 RepID=A0ABN9N9U5_9MYCO|nr:RidA family protein [Mycolicibacterium sp. MU0053]CAJ1501092.1 RidA family protein [Mycolicibacterium sp. MU0053]